MKNNIYLNHFLIITIFFAIFFSSNSFAQSNTVGLLKKENGIVDGYTLFTPELTTTSYLIDNCGEKINEWNFTERPGATVYLLENGNILRPGKDSIEIRDWNNNLIWSYNTTINGYAQHHDVEPLPNGNILCLLSVLYTKDTIVSLGRDTSLTENNFKLDKLIELQPIGSDSAHVVWEWRFIDHLIQDTDPLKPNFGVVSQHPELLNININNGQLKDYTHVNGIDYNEDLDQIIMSARNTSELYIIDHSTSKLEAAGHTGGNAGKGGDFIWRWGNPQMYDQVGSQKLFLQHDSKWINKAYQDGGKISVFNNGGDGSNTFSSIHIIEPPVDGFNYEQTGNEFLPTSFFWSWNGSFFGKTLLEGKKSSTHFLKNGNAIICETSTGQISEIDRNGNHVWSYKTPIGQSFIYNQNQEIPVGYNSIFRAEKYPSDFLGFVGKDMTPLGILENENSLSDSCSIISSIDEEFENLSVLVKNPIENKVISFIDVQEDISIRLLSVNGKIIFKKDNFSGFKISLNDGIISGIYFMAIEKEGKQAFTKLLVL